MALAAIPVGVVLAVSGGRPASLEGLVFFLLPHAGLLATVLSGLGLARACGYVLVSVRAAAPPTCPPGWRQGGRWPLAMPAEAVL